MGRSFPLVDATSSRQYATERLTYRELNLLLNYKTCFFGRDTAVLLLLLYCSTCRPLLSRHLSYASAPEQDDDASGPSALAQENLKKKVRLSGYVGQIFAT